MASAAKRRSSAMRRSKSVPGPFPESIKVLDFHTEGEPIRVVLAGWRQPLGTTTAARRDYLEQHQDHPRRAVGCEPHGSNLRPGHRVAIGLDRR